jgi:hypothetical protein
MAVRSNSAGLQGLQPLLLRFLNVAAEEAAEKSNLMSSRAKRGSCFFANPKKEADSSDKPRPRNDTIGIFPQPVMARPAKTI